MNYISLTKRIIHETIKDKVKCDVYNPENIIYAEVIIEDDDLIIQKIKCQITEPHKCICNCEPYLK